MSYKRDCEHGSQIGKCYICDLVEAENQIAELEKDLETERMRLAACGVVALANTKESAAKQRIMHEDYRSASLSDVIRAVDTEIEQREKIAELEKERDALSKRISCAEQVEKMFAEMPDLTFEQCEKLFPDEFEAHNLEQQAKGVDDFADGNLVGNDLVVALRCIESLHKQVKQLRKGVNHE